MAKLMRSCRVAALLVAGLLAMTSTPREAVAAAVLPTVDVDWGSSFALRTTGGILNPGLLVAFNPQPEPPAGTTSLSIIGDEARLTITDVENPAGGGLQLFRFLFGVGADAGPVTVDYPPDPIRDFRFGFSIDVRGAPVDFTAVIDVLSTSGGVIAPGSEVSFNPQPEPPADGLFGGGFGMDFGVTRLSDVTLSLRILDASGAALGLVRVPEPGTLALFALVLLGLTAVRRAGPAALSCRRSARAA